MKRYRTVRNNVIGTGNEFQNRSKYLSGKSVFFSPFYS